jgi:glutaredoxin-related protein
MNNDEREFKEWCVSKFNIHPDLTEDFMWTFTHKLFHTKEAWEAACIYKQKEIDILDRKYTEDATYLDASILKIKSENKKLRKALEEWIQWENGQILMNGEYNGKEINRLINQAKEAIKK